MKNRLCLFCVLILCFSRSNSQETDLFNYSNSIKYADYLYNTKEFSLAIAEYKRVLFLDSSNIHANIKIHDSYIQAGRYSEGFKFSNQLVKNSDCNDTLLILRGKLMLLTDNFDPLNSEILTRPISSDGLIFLKMSESMFAKNWGNAVSYCKDVEFNSNLQQFAPILKRVSDIHYKSPALSLSLSAIIPGSGKVYSGYWKDGLFSFLFVGITAWQSYRGFNEKGLHSAYGWLMGGISLSFYSGNLYGSVKAAHKKNYETENSILKDYEEAFISAYSNF